MSRPLSEVRRRAEEALATVALRYPNGLGSYYTLSICTSALRALLDATAPVSGSVSTVRSDDPPAKPLPTCGNCGSNFITPAPAPCDGPRRDALRADLLARADAAGDPITSFLSGAAPVAPAPCDGHAAEVERLTGAATEALAVLTRLANSAADWWPSGLPVGLLSEVDSAKARLAGVLNG